MTSCRGSRSRGPFSWSCCSPPGLTVPEMMADRTRELASWPRVLYARWSQGLLKPALLPMLCTNCPAPSLLQPRHPEPPLSSSYICGLQLGCQACSHPVAQAQRLGQLGTPRRTVLATRLSGEPPLLAVPSMSPRPCAPPPMQGTLCWPPCTCHTGDLSQEGGTHQCHHSVTPPTAWLGIFTISLCEWQVLT